MQGGIAPHAATGVGNTLNWSGNEEALKRLDPAARLCGWFQIFGRRQPFRPGIEAMDDQYFALLGETIWDAMKRIITRLVLLIAVATAGVLGARASRVAA